MAKEIYIDGNGNEQLVSGTINNAEMLPIESGSATDTKSYIDSLTASDIEYSAGVSLAQALNYLYATNVGNLNDVLTTGTAIPRLSYYESTAQNKPTGNSGVVITQGNGTYRQQLSIDLEGNLYARYYNNGTISAWVKRSA